MGETQKRIASKAGADGTLRAMIFGVSDGLVSNAALVLGIAGATTQAQGSFVIIAGIAGLLAGAFSMAAGEYVSMRSQSELLERQIEVERARLAADPDTERAAIAETYVRRGFPVAEADKFAALVMSDPAVALEMVVRERLGLDPEQLGSPWGAAIWSFVSFALGAFVPLLPFLVLTGFTALTSSIVLTGFALFSVGAAVSYVTGRSALVSGMRQLLIGAAAAGVTYFVGSLIGVGV